MLSMQTILLLNILLAACCQDLMTDRVSNSLLTAGWGCGVAGMLMPGSLLTGPWLADPLLSGPTVSASAVWIRAADGFLGGAIPLVLLWILFRFRMLGAGDIKLLSVCGTFLGARGSLQLLLASLFCGGILSAVLILYRGNLQSRVHYFLTYLSQYLQDKTIRPYRRPEGRDAEFHFTLAVLAGAVYCLGCRGGL